MNVMKLLMIFVAGAMIFSCASTSGQVGTRYSPSMFDAIDQNHNGVIERDEWLAVAMDRNQANQIFNQADENKDNVVSREEANKYKMLMEQTNMKRSALRLVGPQ
jgi:Ca2+-binding EF-hand superfamily protein